VVNEMTTFFWYVTLFDRAMAQAISRQPLTAEARVQSRAVHADL
jgi:hypothetical protein